MIPITRLTTAALVLSVSIAVAVPALAAGEGEWLYATSLMEEPPRYPEGFAHFDYVNPDAPKGGVVRLSDTGSFDSLNFVPPRGSIPTGLGLIYDTLMTSSMDEVSTDYGLLAEALRYPDDYSSVTYRLREGATWHDGTPITVDDVIFSFDVMTEHNPSQAFYYRHVVSAVQTGERDVTFTFDETGNRELPHIVGQLLILPKHYWEGTDAEGNKRDIARSTLEIPLGSSAYRIKSVSPGRSIVYERVDDWWGRDLNVSVGHFNIDEIRYEYFRDETVELEAFKADQVDWRTESTARVWANSYDFEAVENGSVKRELFEQPYRTAGLMLGFIFNLNRAPFDDVRVRRAFNLAFPYEEINETLFFSQYTRLKSYFDGIPLAAEGLPEGREREILEEIRDLVPPAVFTETFANPVNDTPESERQNLREAIGLLEEAGWTLDAPSSGNGAGTIARWAIWGAALVVGGFVFWRFGWRQALVVVVVGAVGGYFAGTLQEAPGDTATGTKLVNADGEQMAVEFLMNGPLYEKIALRYQQQLAKIGIEFDIRPADTSQYENRVRSRDFDIIYLGWAQSMSPGNEQIDFFGSESARRDGSRNYGAVSDPAIDALIGKILKAPDRQELIALTKALDRVLLHNHYLVPGWTQRAIRSARWDRYAHPEPLPEFAVGFPTIWWWDEDRVAAIEAKK